MVQFIPFSNELKILLDQGLSYRDYFICNKLCSFFSEAEKCDKKILNELQSFGDELIGEKIFYFIDNCESSKKSRFIAFLLNAIKSEDDDVNFKITVDEYLLLSFNLSKIYFGNLELFLNKKQDVYYTSNDALEECVVTSLYNAGLLEHLGLSAGFTNLEKPCGDVFKISKLGELVLHYLSQFEQLE